MLVVAVGFQSQAQGKHVLTLDYRLISSLQAACPSPNKQRIEVIGVCRVLGVRHLNGFVSQVIDLVADFRVLSTTGALSR